MKDLAYHHSGFQNNEDSGLALACFGFNLVYASDALTLAGIPEIPILSVAQILQSIIIKVNSAFN